MARSSGSSQPARALRGGSSAIVTGRSARGTVTKDTFSLAGITAMTNKAQAACK